MSWPEYIVQIEPHDEGELFHMKGAPEPIVRCKDCKHYDDVESTCVHWIDGKCEQWEVEPDDFCAWGVKRDG